MGDVEPNQCLEFLRSEMVGLKAPDIFLHIDYWLIRSIFIYLKFQEDLDTIERMIAEGEASYDKWRHPDPYIGKCHTVNIESSFLGLIK